MVWQPETETTSRWSSINLSSKWWRVGAAGILLLALLAVAAHFIRPRFVEARLERTCRKLIDQKQYRAASILAQQALRSNPRNIEANRIMAEALEGGGSSQAVRFRRQVAELQPKVFENHLAWANTALRFHEAEMAEQALEGISEAEKNNARYHEAEARIAYAQKKPAEMESHFDAAARLEPGNGKYQLNLAASRLLSSDPQIRDAARATIEKVAATPALNQFALQMLIQDALNNSQPARALSLAQEAALTATAGFEDKVYYLALLQRLKDPKFASYLADLQEQIGAQPNYVASLITWLNHSGMALVSIDWSKRLPEKERSTFPVSAAVTEAYAALPDWKMVKDMVTTADWKQFEYVRLALLARALREEGERGWVDRWSAAVKAAGNQPEAVAVLIRDAHSWDWQTEATELLWNAANAGQRWALRSLLQQYAVTGDTRGLLRVASQRLKTSPSDLTAQKNIVLLSCLLNTNIRASINSAVELCQKDPKNPSFALAQAFALFKNGNNDEALQIMRGLEEKQLEEPTFAAYYGVMLAAAGNSEAAKFLDLGMRANLLPEERALVADAREKTRAAHGANAAASKAQP